VNVVVSNIKGGVGTTTTAVYLSAAAVARGYEPVVRVETAPYVQAKTQTNKELGGQLWEPCVFPEALSVSPRPSHTTQWF
jgi:hypothetical protein